MKLKILIIISFIISLLSCSNGKSNWMNTNIDGNLLAEKPSLKDDFYQAVNYEELQKVLLNESDAFLTGHEKINKILTEQIISMVQNSEQNNLMNIEQKRFIELYKMCIDWNGRNKNGLEPVIQLYKKIRRIKKLSELNDLLKNDEDFYLFFPFNVNLKSNNGMNYIPSLSVDFIFERYPEEFSDFYIKMLKNLNPESSESEIEEKIQSAYDLEKKYNSCLYEEKQKEGKTFFWNKINQDFKNFPMATFLQTYGIPFLTCNGTYEVLVFDSLYVEENLENIKTLCICKLLKNASELLDKQSFDNKRILNETINAKEYRFTDEQLGVKILNDTVPEFLGKIWYTTFCSQEVFDDVEKLAYTILDDYKNQISSWDWLSLGSRYNLSKLLENIKVMAGYSYFYDYSELELKLNFFESILQVKKFEIKKQIEKCYSSVDEYEWQAFPQTFNAYYNFINNSVNICAGIIYGLHYDEKISVEEKYGTLGFVLAHEMSHLFSMKNVDGNIYQLFSTKDHAEIEKRINDMADYFSSFTVYEKLKCRGDYCKAEIGADIFAMSIMLDCAKKIEGFDYKLFFESYAKLFFVKYTKNMFLDYYEIDQHPPYYLRVNAIVQQFEEFDKAYDIKPRDGMYLKKKRFEME